MKKFFSAVALLLFISCVPHNVKKEELTSMGNSGEVISFKLENGLTVLLKPDHRSKAVAVQMWVKVGGADESDSEAGISHVVEHMLFKGTEKRGVGEIAREVESVGGDINAYTSDDETVFHLVVPSSYTSLGLDIIADMIQHSRFDPEEFSREKEVILEEIRRSRDDPRRRLYEELMKLVYKKHPYGRPVIGYPDIVAKFTRDQVYNHYKKWYVPNNMVLVVVGDFDPVKVKKEIEDLYRDFKPHPVHHSRPEEPYEDSLRVEVVRSDVPKAYLSIAYLTTPLKSRYTVPLDIFSDFLTGENNRILTKLLKDKEKLVYFLNSYDYTPEDRGTFVITAYLEPENVVKVAEEISRTISRYREELIPEDMLDLLKRETERDFIFARETVQGQARDLGSFQLLAGDYRYEKEYLKRIREVTPEEVREAVRSYLKPERARIVVMIPQNSDIEPSVLKSQIEKAWFHGKGIEKEISGENLGEVEKFTIGGIDLIYRYRDSLPTAAFTAVIPGGIIADPPGKAGLNYVLAHMWSKRSESFSPAQLASELDRIGGSLSINPNRDTITITFTFLSRYMDDALSLFQEILLHPSFVEDDLDEARSDAIAILESLENNMWRYTLGKFLSLYYASHPYGHLVQGKVEDLRKITLEDVKELYHKLISQRPLILSVVGSVDREKVLEGIRDISHDLPPAGVRISYPEPEVITGKTYFERKKKHQTHILLSFPGVSINDRDRIALEVVENILGGMGNRLFVDLRDRKSLAYVVSAANVSPYRRGFFMIYLATAPQKVKIALSSLKEEVEKIVKDGFTDKELEDAKRFMIGSMDVALQSNSSLANTYAINEFYHSDPLFFEKKKKIIESITLKDVNNVAKKYFDLKKADWVIVGEEGR